MTLKISPHAIEQNQGPFIFPGILVGSGPGLPSTPDGTLHVWSGSAGAVTAHANADDLVVENNDMGGISILVPDVTWANIYFGQGAVSNSGFIRYGGVTHQLEFGVNQATIAYWNPSQVLFMGNPFSIFTSGVMALEAVTEIVVNDRGFDVDFRVEAFGQTHALFVQGSDGFVGVSTATPFLQFCVSEAGSTHVANFYSDTDGWGTTFGRRSAFAAGTAVHIAAHDAESWERGSIFAWDYGASAAAPLILQEIGGSVGIGTPAPAELLDVQGNIKVGTNTGIQGIGFGDAGAALAAGGIYAVRADAALTAAGAYLHLGGFSGIYLHAGDTPGAPATAKVTMTNAGNVGVGAIPVTKFHVLGAAGDPSLAANNGFVNLDGATVQCQIGRYTGAPYAIWFQGKNANLDGGTTYPIVFNPLGGNVGVGVIPLEAFHVRGPMLINTIIQQWDVFSGVAGAVRTGSDAHMDFGTLTPHWLHFMTGGTRMVAIDSNGKIILEHTMALKERAAAQADVAGYGQLWVKTASPCELWFTDDAGLDTQIV